MSKTTRGRRANVVKALKAEILRGTLRNGEQLAGENELARRFNVSRGTVRSALEELKLEELITTHTGVGSFVTFDGVALDQSKGWARALADAGSEISTEVLSIVPVDHLPADADGPGVCIRRLRRIGQHTPVSYEVATVPALGPLADLPDTGLVDGSLTASLEAAGLRGVSGEQQVSLERLDADAAALLGRDPGTPFLRTERTTVNAGGDFVEHVVSLLDPDHFRLTLTFGDPA